MSSISRIAEETSFNLEQFLKLVDVHLEQIASEKSVKFDELKTLLAKSDTPPGVMHAALLATLRRTYNHDQLAKARYHLSLACESVEKIDDLPYAWNGR